MIEICEDNGLAFVQAEPRPSNSPAYNVMLSCRMSKGIVKTSFGNLVTTVSAFRIHLVLKEASAPSSTWAFADPIEPTKKKIERKTVSKNTKNIQSSIGISPKAVFKLLNQETKTERENYTEILRHVKIYAGGNELNPNWTFEHSKGEPILGTILKENLICAIEPKSASASIKLEFTIVPGSLYVSTNIHKRSSRAQNNIYRLIGIIFRKKYVSGAFLSHEFSLGEENGPKP